MQTTLAEIKQLYPEQWVLLANPVMDEDELEVVTGIPIYHSKDKKELCYKGRDEMKGYDTITIVYTGQLHHKRRITGIFNRTV